jgi:phosphoesterase RecJ-like protein
MFLSGAKDVHIIAPEEVVLDQYDVLWGVDIAEFHMSGHDSQLPPNLVTINIDHHISNPGWAAINLIEANTIAAAEVLYHLFTQLKIDITPDIATCLLTGISTDSGFFQYCKSGTPFRAAAELIDKGAEYQKIVIEVTKQYSGDDLAYIGKGLELMQVFPDKKLVIIQVPYDVYLAYCSDTSRSELLTPYLASVAGTTVGVLITEKEPHSFRISFRAKDTSVDVSAIAAKLGGGGHKAAAGARVDGQTMDEVTKVISDLITT